MKPVFVIGVPHGGTSAVAGVLHRLGVDMGDFRHRPRSTYDSYEDVAARPFARSTFDHYPVDERGFLRYCDQREAGAYGVWGVKTFASRLLAESSRARSVFRYVWVTRPLLETIDRDSAGTERGPNERWLRARVLTGRLIESRRLASLVHPVASFSFDQLRRHPRSIVHELVDALELETSEEDIDNAIDFVRPE